MKIIRIVCTLAAQLRFFSFFFLLTDFDSTFDLGLANQPIFPLKVVSPLPLDLQDNAQLIQRKISKIGRKAEVQNMLPAYLVRYWSAIIFRH